MAVRLPFATPDEFLSKYGVNLTRGGIYLRSKTVKPPGTRVTLDLKLAGGEKLIHASAMVEFVTGQAGQGMPGMGLKFLSVAPETQQLLDLAATRIPHFESPSPPLPAGVGPADRTVPEPPKATANPPPPSAPIAPAPAPAAAAPSPPSPSAPRLAAAPGPTGVPVVLGGATALSAPVFEEPKEEPKRTGPIIGIDLGTTNSCAAYTRNNKPAVLKSREGYNTVPSILALNARAKLVVGHPAKGQMLTNPRQTVYGAKRLVGRAYDSPIVQHIKDRFHYEIAPGPHAEAAVRLGDRVYTLEQISALVLREVKEIAQNQIGQPVSRAVITVPAYYNDNQRQAVREAGRLAGLHVERILNEPTAAALAYGYGRKLTQRILVYDLGGGTFDASVLELNDNVYEVISTGGDTFLGGLDFDQSIVQHLLQQFEAKTGKAFQGDRVAMQRITDAAERAKCALSERQEMRVHVPFVTMIDNVPYDLDVNLTREKLIALTGGLVDRTIQVCKEVLAVKNLSVHDIDEVILVGGQSRFPLVHEKIQQYFGKPASKSVHPDEAVALGAALFAHSLGQLEGVVLIDVLPMAIGVGLPGGRFKPVLDRNLPLPTTKHHAITTSRDHQSEIELTIFQGEHERAQENEYLGTLKLGGLPKGPKGSVRIDVTFEVSNECLLKVTAKEQSTGREVSTVFTTRDTPDTVKARISNLNTAGDSERAANPASVPPAVEPATPQVPPPEVAAAANRPGGLFGWFKRLFGRS